MAALRVRLRTAAARRRLRAAIKQAQTGGLVSAVADAETAVHDLTVMLGARGGTTPLELAMGFTTLAELHCMSVALPSAARALDCAIALLSDLGEPDWLIAAVLTDALSRRGRVRRLQADWKRADADLTRALRVAPDDTRRAAAHAELGILGKDTGAWDVARAHYDDALRLVHRDGADAASLAALEHNLAGLAHARGEPAAGFAHIRRALALRTSAQGSANEADLISDRMVLVALLAAQQEHMQAENLVRELIDDWTRLRGPVHYEVGHGRHHLAALLHAQGRTTAAIDQYRLALGILRTTLGATHPEVLDVENGLRAAEGRWSGGFRSGTLTS